ncbi:MAG: hypothetical protein AAFR87_24340 [Bacteroidota bacterium]
MSHIEQNKGTTYVLRIALGIITLLLVLPWINSILTYFLGFYLFPDLYGFRSTTFFYLLLLAYYIYRVMGIETIGRRSKTLWIIRFILVGFISLPIFWYFFIWKKEEYALFSDAEKRQHELEEIEKE